MKWIYTLSYERLFLVGLVFTVAVETAVLFAMTRLPSRRSTPPSGLVVFSGCLASAATLPYLWFVLPSFVTSRTMLILVGELSVTAAETVIYRFVLTQSLLRAAAFSLCCNLSSYLLGLLLW